MLSLAYSLISLAFGLNFGAQNPITSQTEPTMIESGNPNAFGHGSFLVYVGFVSSLLACQRLITLIPVDA